MNKRIEWIDIAKAVAIVLVGIGHYSCPKILMAFIYSFHMPLFFILSGITFNTSKYTFQQFFIRKLKTLVFPWCLAVVLYTVFQNTCLVLGMSGIQIPWINIIPRIFGIIVWGLMILYIGLYHACLLQNYCFIGY